MSGRTIASVENHTRVAYRGACGKMTSISGWSTLRRGEREIQTERCYRDVDRLLLVNNYILFTTEGNHSHQKGVVNGRELRDRA